MEASVIYLNRYAAMAGSIVSALELAADNLHSSTDKEVCTNEKPCRFCEILNELKGYRSPRAETMG